MTDRCPAQLSCDDATPDRGRPRYVVTRGGDPTLEELAAVVLALTPVAVDEGASEATPAWVDAALQEGVGRRPFVSADDLASAPPLFT
ncbi:MAG: hypothetical protein KY461_10930 [Actinobacteria bacterium]|nr:hypothetical protein [Actinomycetota bacterium]